MEDKQLIKKDKDYLRNQLDEDLKNVHLSLTSCTMSTIRWFQRYSHCYSIPCSIMCFPLWILILPIAFVLDIFIYTIVSIIFIITFILYIVCAPCMIAYQFSSCSDAWNPTIIYRYSLRQALHLCEITLAVFDIAWSCYCGSGELQNGLPMCCQLCCCKACPNACSQATDIEINDSPCTIL
jgi:hypothetical protein